MTSKILHQKGPQRTRGWLVTPALSQRLCQTLTRLLLLSALMAPLSISGEPVQVRSQAKPGELRLALIWSDPVEFSQSVTGRELLLEFNRALELNQVEQLAKDHPGWIEAATSGYDTLLIRASRPVTFATHSRDRIVGIQLTPSAISDQARTKEDLAAQLRLDLVRAQVLAQSGQLEQSLHLLEQLAQQHPSHVEVLLLQAELEERVERWRRAGSLYQRAAQLDPSNEEIQTARARLWDRLGPRAGTEFQHKRVGTHWSELRTHLSGHTFLAQGWQIGADYDLNQVAIDQVRRPGGELGPFQGLLNRGALYLQSEQETGPMVRGAVFVSRSGVGTGGELTLPDLQGSTLIALDFRRPHWEFIEGLASGGVRDRARIHRRHRFGERVSGSVGAGLNRYGAEGFSGLASSAGAEAHLSYIARAQRPLLVVEYYLDAEYRRSITQSMDSAGNAFFPLPLQSRQVHAFDVFLEGRLTRHSRWEGFGGFAWDLVGGQGPFLGARWTYDLPGRLGLGLWVDQRLNSVNTGDQELRIGSHFFWRF